MSDARKKRKTAGQIERSAPRLWLAPVALALLALAAYSNSFQSGFVLDNKVLILEDRRIRAATVDNLNLIVNRTYWWPYIESALYRPVTTFSYLFNYAVLNNSARPAGYHLVNLLLHIANVLIVFAVVQRLSGVVGAAFLISALWAVHPLSTEAVTNIIGRSDLLAALGVLGAFYAYLRAAEATGTSRAGWLLGVAACTTLGVFSKESAIAILPIVVVFDVLFRRPARSLGDLAAGWLAAGGPMLFLWYQRSVVLAASGVAGFPIVDNPIIAADFWTGQLTAIAVMVRYLALVIWPASLSPDYSYNQIPLATGRAEEWLAWMVVGGVAIAAVMMFRRNNLGLLAVAFALLSFLPASNLLFASGTIMGERLMYLPSLGLIAAAVIAVYRLTAPVAQQWISAALCAAIVLLAGRTWMRNRDWRDDVSLWTSAVRVAPRSFKTHGALAEALYNADPTRTNFDRVLAEKEASLSILSSVPNPEHVSVPYREAATYYLEYGESLLAHDKSAASTARASTAFQRSADHARHFLSLLDIERRRIVRTGSREDLVKLTNETATGQRLLSAASARLADKGEAIEAARRAQTLEPFNPVSYRGTAAALVTAGAHDEAAVTLITGFMITGNAELRQAAAALYRAGLDRTGCAVTTTSGGFALNSSCPIVHEHMCAAAREGSAIIRRQGRPDLAEGLDRLSREMKCGR